MNILWKIEEIVQPLAVLVEQLERSSAERKEDLVFEKSLEH